MKQTCTIHLKNGLPHTAMAVWGRPVYVVWGIPLWRLLVGYSFFLGCLFSL